MCPTCHAVPLQKLSVFFAGSLFSQVKLADRSLMPGDVVRRHIPGEDTQCGFVMDMDVRAHLHILRTNKYIYNVDSRDLEPIQVNFILIF